jgi:hypothetical protein
MEQPIISNFRIELSKEITKTLKSLLETKHLYQSTNVDIDSARATIKPQGYITDAFQNVPLNTFIEQIVNGYWESNSLILGNSGAFNGENVAVIIPGVKILCKECDRIEAFNSISIMDFSKKVQPEIQENSRNEVVQIFVLSFLCQSCKSIPEVFIIRREGIKLILSGRSPMETISVPKDIPKPVKEYYIGALLAFQSGQTLPANFMLRVLIEQWVRHNTQEPASREVFEVIDKYMKSLGNGFTGQFYSIRQLYEELSADIHGATGSIALFEKTLNEINNHFEARRLFKLQS